MVLIKSQVKPQRTAVTNKLWATACLTNMTYFRDIPVGPRQLTLPLQAQYLAPESARQRQVTKAFKEASVTRAGVEGANPQAAYALEMHRTRYRGLTKTHLQPVATAAAINIQRVIDWLWEKPRSQTPKSHFARLATIT